MSRGRSVACGGAKGARSATGAAQTQCAATPATSARPRKKSSPSGRPSLMPIGDTVERHGGLDAVVDKINQAAEETAALSGAGMIDHFRLWGSSRCRTRSAI